MPFTRTRSAGTTPTAKTTKIYYRTLKSEADILAFAEPVERAAFDKVGS